MVVACDKYGCVQREQNDRIFGTGAVPGSSEHKGTTADVSFLADPTDSIVIF